MKIAVDVDEVLCEFIREFLRWYNNRHGTDWTFDDVIDYHWSNFMNVPTEELVEEAHKFFETDRYRNLPLIEGAEEGIKKLTKEHQLYAVTGRQNILEEITKEWLSRNFPGIFKTVEFTNNYPKDGTPTLAKGDICKHLGCEILIDDDTRYVETVLDNGIKLIIFNKPWNLHHRLPDLITRVDSWPEIVRAVNQLAKHV